MKNVTEFMKARARDFSTGNLGPVSEAFTTPTAVYIGPDIYPMTTTSDVEEMLDSCRSRLVSEGYDHTDAELLSSFQPDGKTTVAQIRWHNIDKRGREISNVTASYYCSLKGRDWKIELVEMGVPDWSVSRA